MVSNILKNERTLSIFISMQFIKEVIQLTNIRFLLVTHPRLFFGRGGSWGKDLKPDYNHIESLYPMYMMSFVKLSFALTLFNLFSSKSPQGPL